MTKVLILGAAGSLARVATQSLLDNSTANLTLFLRKAHRLTLRNDPRITVVEGDVLDPTALREAMRGQDIVYANLAGDMPAQARSIITAMHATGVRRLIFVSSMGIYGEVPGERYRSVLDPYRDSAAEIEASDLDYTLLRPGWFTHGNEVDYRLTQKGEPFEGYHVSRVSIADLICYLVNHPEQHLRESLGIARV